MQHARAHVHPPLILTGLVLCAQELKPILLLDIIATLTLMYFPYAWIEQRNMVRSTFTDC